MIRCAPRLAFAWTLFATPAVADDASCRTETFQSARYTVCRVDLAQADLRLFWGNTAGEPYGSFRALAEDLERRGLSLPFAVNAGMYHPGMAPVGLFVEAGAERTPISRTDGPGNFHLKPNGVFYIAGGRAGVMETDAFRAAAPKVDYATQSGPMLLIDGVVHPRFRAESDSRKIRNGVAVLGEREVVFVLTETPVNFHEFAIFFRDGVGARDALFLDGTISSLHRPAEGRSDARYPLGPILGVVSRKE